MEKHEKLYIDMAFLERKGKNVKDKENFIYIQTDGNFTLDNFDLVYFFSKMQSF